MPDQSVLPSAGSASLKGRLGAMTFTAPAAGRGAPSPVDVPLYAVIAGSMVAVFVADLFTPLGIAVWVIYLAPVVLSFFLLRPALPLLLAAAATVLALVGLLVSPSGTNAWVAGPGR